MTITNQLPETFHFNYYAYSDGSVRGILQIKSNNQESTRTLATLPVDSSFFMDNIPPDKEMISESNQFNWRSIQVDVAGDKTVKYIYEKQLANAITKAAADRGRSIIEAIKVDDTRSFFMDAYLVQSSHYHVSILLAEGDISAEDRGQALQKATLCCNPNIVRALLKDKDPIPEADLNTAIEYAKINNDSCILAIIDEYKTSQKMNFSLDISSAVDNSDIYMKALLSKTSEPPSCNDIELIAHLTNPKILEILGGFLDNSTNKEELAWRVARSAQKYGNITVIDFLFKTGFLTSDTYKHSKMCRSDFIQSVIQDRQSQILKTYLASQYKETLLTLFTERARESGDADTIAWLESLDLLPWVVARQP